LLPLIRDFPADVRLLNWIAIGLFFQKKLDQAKFYAQRAVDVDPTAAQARLTLAHTLFALKEFDAAHQHYQRTWDTGLQNFNVAHAHVGCLRDAGRWVDAARIGKAYAVHHAINHHPAVVTLAAESLANLGRTDEALNLVNHCIGLAEANRFGPVPARERVPLFSCRANLLNYAGATPATIRAAHQALAEVLPPEVPLAQRPARDPALPLRVGLISGDFRAHSCAWFLRPLLGATNAARVAYFCYNTASRSDATTDEFRGVVPASQWRDLPPTLPDDRAHALLLADRLDILIDCSGITTDHRLSLLSRRAAPLQFSWLGYPTDTRVPAIAARIVDHFTDPPAEADPQDEPRLLRITSAQDPGAPRFVCYAPPPDAPPAAPLGASPRGAGSAAPFTFCCFNALQKHTPTLYRAWASILAQAPQARLLLKGRGTQHQQVCDDLLERLAAANVPVDRVEIIPAPATTNEHLAAYQSCHLQLDTFPYAGTTTTLESLHMGVPVLTIAAHAHAGRVGASILSAVGHDDLIVSDVDSYVARAAHLANNPGALAPHASNLRARLLSSPLCDAGAFARAFAATLTRAHRDAHPDAHETRA
jgi:predicted O-linked N-acetylglucosamine transferase (SPINDLY family)